MSWLLDTSACIDLIDGRRPRVRARLRAAVAAGEPVGLSAVALFELWYGVARGRAERRAANRAKLQDFLAGPFDVLDFTAADAERAGAIREHLRARGTPIGAYDLLIAGQAASRGLTLVTSNLAEFRRVPSLACEDWAADPA